MLAENIHITYKDINEDLKLEEYRIIDIRHKGLDMFQVIYKDRNGESKSSTCFLKELEAKNEDGDCTLKSIERKILNYLKGGKK